MKSKWLLIFSMMVLVFTVLSANTGEFVIDDFEKLSVEKFPAGWKVGKNSSVRYPCVHDHTAGFRPAISMLSGRHLLMRIARTDLSPARKAAQSIYRPLPYLIESDGDWIEFALCYTNAVKRYSMGWGLVFLSEAGDTYTFRQRCGLVGIDFTPKGSWCYYDGKGNYRRNKNHPPVLNTWYFLRVTFRDRDGDGTLDAFDFDAYDANRKHILSVAKGVKFLRRPASITGVALEKASSGNMGCVLFDEIRGFSARQTPGVSMSKAKATELATAQPDGTVFASSVPGPNQGGVVVDGVAYFTSSRGDKQNLYAFDIETLKIKRIYDFNNLWDSSPLVIQKKDGTWLILAHEWKNSRTVARYRDSGKLAWVSAENQPGNGFFGYSYYIRQNGDTLILAESDNGLHAMNLDNGQDVWYVPSIQGVTPCVDQKGGYIYFQSYNRVDKIAAETGHIIKSVHVPNQKKDMTSWNTVLVNDKHGYYIATYWYKEKLYGSSIKVFDADLKMIWERKALPMSMKPALCYHNGKLIAGFGNSYYMKGVKRPYVPWSDRYRAAGRNDWQKVVAHDIRNGKIVWECDLKAFNISQVDTPIYVNGYILVMNEAVETPYSVFIIDAANGKLLHNMALPFWGDACAHPLFTFGRLYTGDHMNKIRVNIFQIGEGEKTDWSTCFGVPQLNHNAAPDSALQRVLIPSVGK